MVTRVALLRFVLTDSSLADLAEMDPGFASRRRALVGSKLLDEVIALGLTKPDGEDP